MLKVQSIWIEYNINHGTCRAVYRNWNISVQDTISQCIQCILINILDRLMHIFKNLSTCNDIDIPCIVLSNAADLYLSNKYSLCFSINQSSLFS